MELNLILPRLAGCESKEYEKCKKAAANQWSDSIKINVIEEDGDSYPEIFNAAIKKLSNGNVLFLFPWVILRDKAFDNLNQPADLVLYGYEQVSWNQPELIKLQEEKFCKKDFARELHNHPGSIAYTAIWNKVLSVDIIKKLGLEFDASMKDGYEYDFILRYISGCNTINCSNGILATFFTQPQPAISTSERIRDKIKLLDEYEQLLFECEDRTEAEKLIDKERLDYIIYEKSHLRDTSYDDRCEAEKLLKKIRGQLNKADFKTDLLILAKTAKAYVGVFRKYWTVDRKNQNRALKEKKAKEREQYLQENFYKRRALLRYFHKKFGSENKILLYCENTTMKPHIMDYYRCVKGIEKAKFYIYYPDNWNSEIPKGVIPVKSKLKALYMPWDLVVCADAKVPLYYRKCEAGILYINHGLHMISYDGGENLYAYDEGCGKFSGMLEPNKSYAAIMSENTGETVFHTGYKNSEGLMEQRANRAKYRKQLGFSEDETVVAVFGSWGPDSLFHKVGNALIQQAKDLMKDNYRFILSIHPREYQTYDETVEPLGDYIESLAADGFVIRNPKEPSIDYMVAADIIICDYSSLCEEAMLTGKSVILSDFPASRVWKESIIAKYQKKGIIFDNNSDLRALLRQCNSDSQLSRYASSLVEDLIPPEGGYKKAVLEATERVLEMYK